jgi:methionyl-tRNA formyltransferase
MTRVILCGYRQWAFKIFDNISHHHKIKIVAQARSKEEFESIIHKCDPNEIDLLLFIGWSWLVEPKISKNFLCLGLHPSDLPNYRGGSPLQHQIIDGLKSTKISLMTLSTEKIDAGEVWLKENLDLTGSSMNVVFDKIVESSVKLLNLFFDSYPDIQPKEQNLSLGSYFSRRKPTESRIYIQDFSQKSLEELYNFMRCLTDPYPNAYIEDENGNKLVFRSVEYISNKEKN